MPLVETKDLTIKFGDNVVLNDISFRIDQEDIMAIIGPNGAGKTVLIKAILGLIKPTSGKIIIKESLRIGYAPQVLDFDRSFPLTVEEFMLMQSGSRLILPGQATKTKISEILEEVGALDLLKNKMGRLSGGQLQRVLIASSLAADPDIVFLDEPSSGVDIGGEQTIYHLLDELHKTRHLALVIVSHDIDFVYRSANRVLCLNKQNLCFGVPEEALTADVLNKVFKEMVAPYHHKEHDHA